MRIRFPNEVSVARNRPPYNRDNYTNKITSWVGVVEDSVEAARSYFDKNRLPFPCLVDPSHEIYHRYNVETKLLSLGQRPGLFIIDRDGIVRYAHIGSHQWEIPGNAQVLEVCRGLQFIAQM